MAADKPVEILCNIANEENDNRACYGPLKTFEELVKYGEENNELTCPQPCKTMPLNRNFSDLKSNIEGHRFKQELCPKTLVCHDFKGGYLDDKFVEGTENSENYIFRHWLQTDIFVYFSHHFVTIPPIGWINAAHSHGVQVLGTIITEWDDGVKICDEMLKDVESVDKCVAKLCEIAKDYGFEGYLVNIENELKSTQVPLMIQFLEKLTIELKKDKHDNLVIWYDSVTTAGELKWQDCLNELNKSFFDACDGIYLNYGWNDEKLKLTLENAGESRRFDVFVGIDVFGRGCFGGGGRNSCQAVEKVYNHQLSYAIFAPGWSFETQPYNCFQKVDDALWLSCSKYFYFRCLKDEFQQTPELLSPTRRDTVSKKFKVFFATNFSRGFGTKEFIFGQEPKTQPWFNISKQSYQPVILLSTSTCYDEAKCDKVFYDTESAFSGGGSVRIQNSKRRPDYEHALKFSPIWFPLNISFSSNRMSVAVLAAWKSASVDHQLQIYLEVGQKNFQTKKILLGSVDHLAASVGGKYYIHLKLSHFLPELFINSNEEVEFFFRKNNYDEKEVNGWRISCFLFDLDESHSQKYIGINSIKVGAEGDISLGFLSLAQIIHYTDCD